MLRRISEHTRKQSMARLVLYLLVFFVFLVLEYISLKTHLSMIIKDRKRATRTVKVKAEPKNQDTASTHFLPRRPFLVFSSVGLKSKRAIKSWSNVEERNFDLVLYYYEGSAQTAMCFDYCYFRSDFKWPNFYDFLTNNKLNENSYTAALVIDDDMVFNGTSINKAFEIFTKLDLKFAQPSFTADSDMHLGRHQMHRRNDYARFVNIVENSIMFTKFKYAVKLKELMIDVGPGYGIDYCFMRHANISVVDVALIHAVKAYHPYNSHRTEASTDLHSFKLNQTQVREFRHVTGFKSENRIRGEAYARRHQCYFYKPKFGTRIYELDDVRRAQNRTSKKLGSHTAKWVCFEEDEMNQPCPFVYGVDYPPYLVELRRIN